MSLNCNICNKELDAFSGGRCKVCRTLICKDCIANGGSQLKDGIVCINCAHEQNKPAVNEKSTENEQPQPAEKKSAWLSSGIIIITAFSLLFSFIYIIATPYVKTRNALKIIEFGPDENFSDAKNTLAEESGSYILTELEDMAIKGRKNTAIRAVKALGAQPGSKPLLILKQLQLNNETPEFLRSVIIEAILEHERLYEEIKPISE